MNLILYPIVRHLSESKGPKGLIRVLRLRSIITYFIIVSLVGIRLLADTRLIYEYILGDNVNDNYSVIFVSIFSFTIMDVGLEML